MDDTPAGEPPISVSVVIPTRNRPESLSRLLRALGRQRRRPIEVLIVDASDEPDAVQRLTGEAHPVPVTVIRADPSACAQRNLGIARATGSHVLLLDDDIEPGDGYLEALVSAVAADPDVGAVTGVLQEPGGAPEVPVAPSPRHLVFAFLFQLDVFADTEATRPGPLVNLLRRWYRRRGNTWSLAGWPLVTQVDGGRLRTAIYGLGAALVRRDWLMASPFDEGLGPHGIGDNYGVALGLPGTRPVTVLLDVPVLHHRSAVNRLPPASAFASRVRALARFTRSSARFGRATRVWLAWSLLGRSLAYAVRGPRRLALTALVLAPRVMLGRR